MFHFMFHMGWLPKADEWKQSGRDYLTVQSKHAREVQARQLAARAAWRHTATPMATKASLSDNS
eukprot:5792473-Heterocapsa_arctica.AAC.1